MERPQKCHTIFQVALSWLAHPKTLTNGRKQGKEEKLLFLPQAGRARELWVKPYTLLFRSRASLRTKE